MMPAPSHRKQELLILSFEVEGITNLVFLDKPVWVECLKHVTFEHVLFVSP
jgi:hypothetical protein